MVNFFSKLQWLLLLFLSLLGCTAEEKNNPACQVSVLTYSNFTSLLGPGKSLEKSFKKKYNCSIKFKKFTSTYLLKKLLEKNSIEFDIIIGIDQSGMGDFKGHPQLLNVSETIQLPLHKAIESYKLNKLLPIDWAPLTLIRQLEKSEDNVRVKTTANWEFKAKSLSLQDPRTSSTGMQFLWWWDSHFKAIFDFKSIHSLSPSWSYSYGIFQSRRVNATFSYLTSLVYEWGSQPDNQFLVYKDPKGHPLQVEFLAIPQKSTQKEQAIQLAKFIVSTEGQKILMQKNYMFPANGQMELLGHFQHLPDLPTLSLESYIQFEKTKDKALANWKNALAKE